MIRPPKTAAAFLRWFCREDCADELEGDLTELYRREFARSPARAAWMFRLRVVKYFRPEFLKPFHRGSTKFQSVMYKNYFATAWRSLLNNRLHTALNITGLSIGISACIVIYNIAAFELSFNQDVPDNGRIFRIYSQFRGTYEGINPGVCSGLQTMVKTEFTGLEEAVNFDSFSAKVSVPGVSGNALRKFDEQNDPVITGPEYFNLIRGFQWTAGEGAGALNKPFQVILTEEKAELYFGTRAFESLLGREIRYQDSLVLSVAGIVRPPSYHTDFVFTDFISMATVEKSFLKNAGFQDGGWENTNGGSQLFIKLMPGTSLENIQAQLRIADEKSKTLNAESSYKPEFKLQPLSELHFNGDLGSLDCSRTANKTTLLILSLVGLMLLIIAAINFINLETAQAGKRAKEVGVRKVLGGVRSQLFGQFLVQSLLVTLFATALALLFAEVCLHTFSDYIPSGVALHLLRMDTVIFLVGVVAVVGALAGFYPAIVMSSFLPVKALKNEGYGTRGGSRSALLRRGLIIFQFAFAQVLIIGTLVMLSQIRFMLNKDLGFKKDAILTFHGPYYERPEKLMTLRNELLQIPELDRISLSSAAPLSGSTNSRTVTYKTKNGNVEVQVYYKIGDEHYMPLFGLTLISGRMLTPSDSTTQVIVNETYLKKLQLKPEEAIGQEVWMGKKPHQIVGVVRDFNTVSLREGLQPLIIHYHPGNTYVFAVKLRNVSGDGNGSYSDVLAKMETAWKKVFPDEKFTPEFYDQTIANFYKSEQRTSRLTFAAMSVAILICCLGLFGLVSFNAANRTKEIGVRKTLGAGVGSIVILLSKDIVYLVTIAFVLAVPLAYYASGLFLEKFAFRTPVGWHIFVIAGVSSVLLALATASHQAIKAARVNPVNSLRAE